MGQEEGLRGCLFDKFLPKAFKGCGKEIAQEQIAQALSFQNFLAPNRSTLPLSLGFQAEILRMPLFGKLINHLPSNGIFLLGPIELNDSILWPTFRLSTITSRAPPRLPPPACAQRANTPGSFLDHLALACLEIFRSVRRTLGLLADRLESCPRNSCATGVLPFFQHPLA